MIKLIPGRGNVKCHNGREIPYVSTCSHCGSQPNDMVLEIPDCDNGQDRDVCIILCMECANKVKDVVMKGIVENND